MNLFIGIDTGLTGGIAVLDACGKVMMLAKMPVISSGKKNRIDPLRLKKFFDHEASCSEALTITIEDPGGHAPSATGLASMSRSFATCLTVIELGSYRHEVVYAQGWQKVFWNRPKMPKGTKFDTKAAALDAARKLWPKQSWLASERSSKPHDGLVDAALIAEYGRRKLG